MNTHPTHGNLFSGIGGFELAAQWAGFGNVFSCEIDPFCRKVLAHRLKNHNKKNAEKSNLSEQIAHKVGGGTSQLNPLFVEEMMGFPEGWTVSPFLDGGENPSRPTATP